ncbi:MAG: hypothetical protein ABW061_06955 [Polyangiaceae bacterium]
MTFSISAPNPHYLEVWTRTVDLVLDQFQAGLLVITIIDRLAQAPDDVSKANIRNTVTRHSAQINAFAYVVEGEGFRSAAMRSAISLISMAARYPFPQKVFGRPEDAVPWMLSRPHRSEQGKPRAPDAAKLIQVATSLRSQLSAVAEAG